MPGAPETAEAITPDMDACVAIQISNTYAKLLAKDYNNCLIL